MGPSDLLNNTGFWNKYKSEASKGESIMYRYEQGGVLIYDSHARFSDELPQITEIASAKQPLKAAEGASEYGTS